MRLGSLILTCVLMVGLCGCKGDGAKNLKDTMHALNEEGVQYSGTIESPMDAGFEMYSGGRVRSGGWFSIRVSGPNANPRAGLPAAPEPKTDEPAAGSKPPADPGAVEVLTPLEPK